MKNSRHVRQLFRVGYGTDYDRVAIYEYLLYLFALPLLLVSLAGCSMDDPRDECCEDFKLNVRYIRTPDMSDKYRQYIKRSEHFLFDSAGVLESYKEVTGTKEERMLAGGIPYGRHTLLVLGNRGKGSELDYEIGKSRLEEMILRLSDLPEGEKFHSSSDRLYWGVRTFERKKNRLCHYICDMSNIHCILQVTVRWRNSLPKEPGLYTMQLRGVTSSYHLKFHERVPYIYINPGFHKFLIPGEREAIHSFPATDSLSLAIFRQQVSMSSAELYGEFVTLRYDDEQIPSFRVYKDGTPLMKEIDLTKFFRSMNWVPSEIPEQRFRIIVTIDPLTGLVEVREDTGLGVLDWEDGGMISTTV